MKTRYLDIKNCQTLLPRNHGLPFIKLLENCLYQFNAKKPQTIGLISKLIERNIMTINTARGMDRLIPSNVEIGLLVRLKTREVFVESGLHERKGPAQLHIVFDDLDYYWKCIIPLQYLLKGWGDANDGYQCYMHSISHNTGPKNTLEEYVDRLSKSSLDDYYYVGITGRNWLQRFDEHIYELNTGSRRDFYKIWRESIGIPDVKYVSQLANINQTYDEAMNWEEYAVDNIAYGPNGLNMIPGGFKGLKMLHKLRITPRERISIEEREWAMTEYIRQNPRKGIPNPFISDLWKDDEFYLKVMQSRKKTLSPDQVKMIRKLDKDGWDTDKIVKEVGALNETQVKNVISGRTYKRIN